MLKKILTSFLICLLLVCPITLSACKNNPSNPLVSIRIDGTLKNEFYQGEQLDIDGIKVALTYQDGTTSSVVLSNSMISGFDSSVIGDHTLTITYEGKTTTHSYHVHAVRATSIELTSTFKTTYYTDSALDVSGGKIFVNYEDGTFAEISVTAEMISEFEPTTAGEKTLVLTHAGQSINIHYQVKDAVMTNIAIKSQFKTEYFVGESLVLDGGSITATYENDDSETITITPTMVDGFDSTTAGSKILTVTYKGKTIEVPYKINAIEVTGISLATSLDKTEYLEGEALDITGGTINVYYSNGTSTIIAITEKMTSGFNNTYVNEAEKTLTITYSGFTTTLKYSIIEIKVVALELTHTFKTEYYVGETINVSGGLLTATYNNESVEENIVLTNEMIADFYASTPGSFTMTITYKTFSIECDYTIIDVELQSIELTTTPTKTEYYVGDETYDLTGGVITLYYSNNTTETISATNNKVRVTGFSTYEAGEDKTMTLKYNGFTTTFTYSVVEAPTE